MIGCETCARNFKDALFELSNCYPELDYPHINAYYRNFKRLKTDIIKCGLMNDIIEHIQQIEDAFDRNEIPYDFIEGHRCVHCVASDSNIEISICFTDYLYDTLCKFIIENKEIFDMMETQHNLYYREFKHTLVWLITNYDKKYKDYYKEIFGLPYFLDVPIKHYNNRQNVYFSDVICGHPKASHGWCHEAMENLRELGCF